MYNKINNNNNDVIPIYVFIYNPDHSVNTHFDIISAVRGHVMPTIWVAVWGLRFKNVPPLDIVLEPKQGVTSLWIL